MIFTRQSPHAGLGVERIGPVSCLAGCHKRQLKPALSVLLSYTTGHLKKNVLCCSLGPLTLWYIISCFSVMFCLLILVRLSVPVHVIDWKDVYRKWPTAVRVDVDIKPYSRHCLSPDNNHWAAVVKRRVINNQQSTSAILCCVECQFHQFSTLWLFKSALSFCIYTVVLLSRVEMNL